MNVSGINSCCGAAFGPGNNKTTPSSTADAASYAWNTAEVEELLTNWGFSEVAALVCRLWEMATQRRYNAAPRGTERYEAWVSLPDNWFGQCSRLDSVSDSTEWVNWTWSRDSREGWESSESEKAVASGSAWVAVTVAVTRWASYYPLSYNNNNNNALFQAHMAHSGIGKHVQ